MTLELSPLSPSQARSQFKSRSTANNVSILVPVPSDADSPKFKTSTGSTKWVPEKNVVQWNIKSFPVSVKKISQLITYSTFRTYYCWRRAFSHSTSIRIWRHHQTDTQWLKVTEYMFSGAVLWVFLFCALFHNTWEGNFTLLYLFE